MNLRDKIVAATTEVFTNLIMLDASPVSSHGVSSTAMGDRYSSMVGMSGDFQSLLSIHCPEKVARVITAAMLGLEPAEVADEEMRDALGEVANMVAGDIKTAFSREGKVLNLSIPTTVSGSAYRLNSLAEAKKTRVCFAAAPGEFLVEFHLRH